jgi:bifunctional UDP-N-acetylglucosamine pyrophosphorylase/glucosamine-1-phosphate N-acetyltransferase
MTENVRVVILAAGLGTRMRSNKAKVLHEAGGDTLLNHVIRAALHVAPAESIVAVIGHQAEQVRESVKVEGVRFAEQKEQRGTGHAVLCARKEVGAGDGKLLILNGDGPLLRPATLQALLQMSSRSEGGGIVTVAAIVEQKAATPEQLQIREINPGVYCFNARLFWEYIEQVTPDNPANEYYLTDIVGIMRNHGHAVRPLLVRDETELLGINTRIELAVADKILRGRKIQELMLSGVTVENPESVTVDVDVEVGQDSLIEANVQLRGRTKAGANCHIGAGSILRDCELADSVRILPYVVADSAKVGRGASIGPFSRLRLNAEAGEDTHIGNFVELKKTKLGKGSKASHLTYLGDAAIGSGTNIGAGTITCNYDGAQKHQTIIGEGAFIGSNSTLVAPLTVSDGSYVAAGSTITKNVEADALAIGRAYQVEKPGWAKKRRAEKNRKS